MRDADNIRDVEALGIDWMGFIFYPKSQRYVNQLPAYLPNSMKRVGVFVNERHETILEKIELFQLDIVQLHGDESPEYCAQLAQHDIQILKAFGIADTFPSGKMAEYEESCHYFLLIHKPLLMAAREENSIGISCKTIRVTPLFCLVVELV